MEFPLTAEGLPHPSIRDPDCPEVTVELRSLGQMVETYVQEAIDQKMDQIISTIMRRLKKTVLGTSFLAFQSLVVLVSRSIL